MLYCLLCILLPYSLPGLVRLALLLHLQTFWPVPSAQLFARLVKDPFSPYVRIFLMVPNKFDLV